VSVTFDVSQTPLIAGRDPFERFPKTDGTSVGTTAPPTRGSEPRPGRKLASALSAVVAALMPTRSPSSIFPLTLRGWHEHVPSTLATSEDVGITRSLGIELPVEPSLDLNPPRAIPRSNAARALRAATDLTTWLGVTEEHVADLAGFSRRNYSNWRNGQGSYSKTIRGLFEIHALVGGLVKELGTSDALAWLTLPASSGCQRQQLLATELGRAELLGEASRLLFAEVRRDQVVADFEEAREGAELASNTRRSQALAEAPPRRRRKPE
jgi:transcriptional regulator with XRE-family HTH domain